MQTAENKIIKTLDNPPRFLYWELKECMILIFSFLIGGAFESLVVLFVGIASFVAYRKLNFYAKKIEITPFHFLYWNLPTDALRRSGKFKTIPSSHKRDIVL